MRLNLMVKVAGVTYENRQHYLKQLSGDEAVRIVPEPDNPFDPNALAVHIALKSGEIAHCGFVPRDLAKEIAPLLDGEPIMVRISQITGGFDMGYGGRANLGLTLHVELEGDEEAIPDDPGF